ncbi:NACHT domain-containing protein [Fusarium sp. LHS14.1]|nr:NACHT domain-containing protein [Fusarium sp. LHS14.1]
MAAETIGIVAACGQFVEQSVKIIRFSKEVHDKFQDAPAEIEAWRQQIQGLEKLVTAVEASPALQVEDLKPTVEQAKAVGDKLLRIFEGIDFEKDDGFGHKSWRVVGAFLKEDEIGDHFREIERLKALLGDQIAVININQGHDKFSRVESLIQDLGRSFRPGTDEDQCLQDLFITDPLSDRDGIITAKGRRTPGTCEWIPMTEEYRSWSTDQSGLLWISGPPGKGKTFISIFLTQLLQSSKPDDTVIWFFCDNKVASRNTAVNILRGLIIQLIFKHNQLISRITPTWKIQGANLFQDNSFETLWRIFEDMLEALKDHEVCCVLGALDECDEPSLSSLLFKIQSMFEPKTKTAQIHSLKLLITSREQPECLPATLSTFPHITLGLLEHDIQLYISDQISHLARIKGIEGSPLCQYIEYAFRKRARGTFLWVSFMARELEHKTVKEIEHALTQLPRDLPEVYEQILSKIKPESKTEVGNMLTWLLFASRPLTVVELCDAVQIKPTPYLTKEQVCLDYIQSCGHLIQVSSGRPPNGMDYRVNRLPPLIPVATNMTDLSSKESSACLYVSFVHQSAKDFLKNHSSGLAAMNGPVDSKKTHADITNRLLSLLEVNRPFSQLFEAAKDLPLLPYAVFNWNYHMREMGADFATILDEHKDFFRRASEARDRWWAWYFEYPGQDTPRDVPLLHMACITALYRLLEYALLKRNTLLGLLRAREVNRVWGHDQETPLHLMVKQGQDKMVHLLLKYGADASIKNVRGKTALDSAAFLGPYAVFLLLAASRTCREILEADAKSSIPHRGRETLLHTAARGGHQDICQELVARWHYDVETKDKDGFTPLLVAVRCQHLSLASFLVKNLGAKTEPQIKILELAFYLREKSIINEALESLSSNLGIDINAADEDGNTLFHRLYSPAFMMLEECIAAGLRFDKRNQEGETVLHRNFWLSATHERLHLVLKEPHLDINARDSNGRTPLHALVTAAAYPDQAPWSLDLRNLVALLDFGADRSLMDAYGRTSSDLAAEYLKQGSIEIYIEEEGIDSSDEIDEMPCSMLMILEILSRYATAPLNVWVEDGLSENMGNGDHPDAT